MVAPSKRLIPVELLRRSTRNSCKRNSTLDCDKTKDRIHQAIKKENVVDYSDDEKDKGNSCSKRVKLEPDEISSQHHYDDAPMETKKDLKTLPDGFLLVDEHELDLERTLLGGQSFRWIKHSHSGIKEERPLFTGTVGRNVFQIWRYDDKRVAYNLLNIEASDTDSEIQALLNDYFQLKYKLSDLYPLWSVKDENFKKCSQNYTGFRILRQDPVENVFSFICATNNNIKRISLMISGLCRRFGQQLLPRKASTVHSLIEDRFYTFPTVERLAADDVFNVLRYELGFGYRAKFICETAKMLVSMSSCQNIDNPRNYLESLRQTPYKETCRQLQKFPGIGRKVADCICLMSMDHLCSVPIDCHIYEIVCRNYMKTLRQERKTLTEKVHDLIGDYFVDLHGPLAGWATSVLFIGELKHLKQETDNKANKNQKKANKKQGSER